MKACIVAGGFGTRVSEQYKDIPKCLIPIGRRPVLFHQFDLLRKHGFEEVVLLVGEKAAQIVDAVDRGYDFGLKVTIVQEPRPLGVVGAVVHALPILGRDFLLLLGDVLANEDLSYLQEMHVTTGSAVTPLVKASTHYVSSPQFDLYSSGEIKRVVPPYFQCKEVPCPQNRSWVGIAVCSADIFTNLPNKLLREPPVNVFDRAIQRSKCYAVESTGFVGDIGTVSGLDKVTTAYIEGRFDNLICPAIFLDRDGVINQLHKNKFVNTPDDFELCREVAESVGALKLLGYLVFVVTNQGGIELGHLTENGLAQIHGYMHALLAPQGVVDKVYHCPHFEAPCNCRKPKPGMLLRATVEYNIDLSRSWMVGDSESDIEAGIAAGVHTCLIDNETKTTKADVVFPSLVDFVASLED